MIFIKLANKRKRNIKPRSLAETALYHFGFLASGSIASSLLLAACGSTPPKPAAVPPPPAAPAAPVAATASGPINAASCSALGGAVITGAGGVQLCKVIYESRSMSLSFSGGSSPIVSPISYVTGRGAYQPGFTLKKNDKVIFSGQASWGVPSTSSYLGGFLSFTTFSCSLMNGDGKKISDGTAAPLNEGAAPGVMISDGVKAYFIGQTGSVVIANDGGTLRVGLNIPTSGATSACGNLSILRLAAERCTNAAGVGVGCP